MARFTQGGGSGSGGVGSPGPKGDPGLSAYAIAVQNGFVGTEAQWIASLQGVQGTLGLQGTKGAQGILGAQGISGFQGISGIQGTSGTNGAQGLIGLQGTNGSQGIAGANGTNGLNGANGTNGTNGLGYYAHTAYTDPVQIGWTIFTIDTPTTSAYRVGDRVKGTDMDNSTKYFEGLITSISVSPYTFAIQVDKVVDTVNAWSGYRFSLVGEQGAAGIQGTAGKDGIDGINGTNGTNGIDGINGIDGTNGVDGKSAYQLAVLDGFYGTETQWLASLKGVQGTTGQDGSNGLNGTSFIWRGAWDIANTYEKNDVVSNNGNSYIALSSILSPNLISINDSYYWELMASKGSQGNSGADGIDGQNGQDALWNYTGAYNSLISYSIGDLAVYEGSLWYRKNTNGGNLGDTPAQNMYWDLIASKGDKGDTGIQGIQGLLGIQGIQGNQGITGQTGIQGTSGTDGLQGIQGSIGIGIQGSEGTQGIQGNTGFQGLTGLQGATGVQGQTGLQGTQGTQGVQGLIGNTGIQGSSGDRYFTTSSTTLTIGGNGQIVLVVGTGLSYTQGQTVLVSYDENNLMHGTVYSYNSTTGQLTLDLKTSYGSGTYSIWIVNVDGAPGIQGPIGATGSSGAQGTIGATGLTGLQGLQGSTGSNGQGVPSGGTAGQILAKTDSTDYNTYWMDAASSYSGYTSTVKHDVKAGESITKGQAVYVSSADGTNIIVSKASNSTELTSSKTMGLLFDTVSLNGKTTVVTEGLLSGLDTSTATAGDPVWLGTDGNLIYGLANKPVAPAHLVFIGIVTKSNNSTGEIFVKVENGFELEELHNLVLTNVQNGDAIVWDSVTSKWINKDIGATGAQGTQGTSGASIQGVQGTTGIQGTRGMQGLMAASFTGANSATQAGIGTGSYTFGVSAPGAFQTGDYVRIWNSSSAYMEGTITGTTAFYISIDVTMAVGSGIYSSWIILLAGVPGTQGTTGIQGLTGSSGIQGATGTSGSTGSQGTIGSQGTAGTSGTQGITGAQGSTGLQGSVGFGVQGIQGSTGTQGLTGTQGNIGLQGIAGSIAAQGIQGTQGIQGNIGTQGATGIGYDGITSSSTVTIATGVKTFVLNKIGPIVVGSRIRFSAAYNYYMEGTVTYVNGTSININIDAIAGAGSPFDAWSVSFTGLIGSQGVQGISGTQGTLGTGLQGSTGSQGTTGTQGATGIQGNTGIQGTTGSQGIQGRQGTTGLQGIQGIQGVYYSSSSTSTNTIGLGATTWAVTNTSGFDLGQYVTVLGKIGGFVQAVESGYITAFTANSSMEITIDKIVNGSGSYSQWSFVAGSAPGNQGIQGTQGTTGIQGPLGIQGSVGTQGTQGTVGSQGATGLQGALGLQGTQGVQGIQGAYYKTTSTTSFTAATGGVTFATSNTASFSVGQGVTVISSDESVQMSGTIGVVTAGTSIYINITKISSGLGSTRASWTISLSGNDGLQGIQGLQGRTGTQGAVGIDGTMGIQGNTGTQGTQGSLGYGAQGTTGTQGLTGLQGSTGFQGTNGLQGTTGPQGINGTQGVQGVQGLYSTSTITLNQSTVTDTDPLILQSKNGHGGATFAGLVTLTNTGTGATNINKFIRMSPTGGLEVINSAYTANIFTLSDSGDLSGINNIIANGNINGVALNNNAWTSFTPALSTESGSWTIGNGTIEAAYKLIGKTCHFRVKIVWGSTTSTAGGALQIGLPFTAASANYQFPASILDNGNAWYQATGNGMYNNNTSKFALIYKSSGTNSSSEGVTGTSPFTFGNGDYIALNGTYEIA